MQRFGGVVPGLSVYTGFCLCQVLILYTMIHVPEEEVVDLTGPDDCIDLVHCLVSPNTTPIDPTSPY